MHLPGLATAAGASPMHLGGAYRIATIGGFIWGVVYEPRWAPGHLRRHPIAPPYQFQPMPLCWSTVAPGT